MRKRVVRDLGTILGVVIILASVVLLNGFISRGSMSTRMVEVRLKAEDDQKAMGVTPLSWKLLGKTTGGRRQGPIFDSELTKRNESVVDIVGFMVPLYEFRAVKEFLLLPKPIECYFCRMPPMRDVIYVKVKEGTAVELVKEPVVVSGTLSLNQGPGTKFFYVMNDAKRGAAERNGKLTKQSVSQEQVMHAAGAKQQEESAKEPLLEGKEPPKQK